MSVIFISDLHLSGSTPALNLLFANTINAWRGKIDALYILGDLFDSWIGDDDDDFFVLSCVKKLREFSTETPLYIMRGNRDFLLGAAFAEASGATLLDDPYCLNHNNKNYLLTHGDSLCADDVSYQKFRQMTHDPAWQAATLSKSLDLRRLLAKQLRAISEENYKQSGDLLFADVSEQATQKMLQSYISKGIDIQALIHGHTHKPATHQHFVGEREVVREVLINWQGNSGGYLQLDAEGLIAHKL